MPKMLCVFEGASGYPSLWLAGQRTVCTQGWSRGDPPANQEQLRPLVPKRSIFATIASKSNATAKGARTKPGHTATAGNVKLLLPHRQNPRKLSFDVRRTGLPHDLASPITGGLERQPQSKLHEARIASKRCDGAYAAIGQGRIRLREQHAIGQIEGFPAELEVGLLVDFE